MLNPYRLAGRSLPGGRELDFNYDSSLRTIDFALRVGSDIHDVITRSYDPAKFPRSWVGPDGLVHGLDLLDGSGVFVTGYNGWSDASAAGGSISWTTPGSVGLVSDGAGAAKLRSTATTVSGLKYRVQGVGSAAITLNVGTSAGGTQYGTAVDISGASNYVEFTATGTTVYIELTHVAAATRTVRDVFAYEILPTGVRVDYTNDAAGEMMVSAQSYNMLAAGRAFDLAVWAKTNITPTRNQTGADGRANYAYELEATDANGTILAAFTASSAQRSFQIKIKRLTGTGAISITDDGGSTYTAVTSSLSTSAWYKATITTTQANPSVGIKITTSGDTIAVDMAKLNPGVTMPYADGYPKETLGAEIATGTLTSGLRYLVTEGTVGGHAVGVRFDSDGTETCDASNKVKQITSGMYINGTLYYGGYNQLVTDTSFAAVTEGSDAYSGWDLTNWTAVNATINDADTFTANSPGGAIYKTVSVLNSVGVCFRLVLEGTISVAGSMNVISKGATVSTVSGAFAIDIYANVGSSAPTASNLFLQLSNTGISCDLTRLEVYPVTLTNWTVGAGWAPQATAGVLTGKAQKIAGTAAALEQAAGAVANHAGEIAATITIAAGTLNTEWGGVNGASYVAGAAIVDRIVATGTGNLKFEADATYAGTIDDATLYDLGPATPTEGGEPKWTNPAIFTSAFTFAMAVRFPFGYAFLSTAGDYGLMSADGNAKGLLYVDENGDLCTWDGANETVHSVNWAAATEYIFFVRCTGSVATVGSVVAGTLTSTDGTWDGAHAEGAELEMGVNLPKEFRSGGFILTQKALTNAQIAALKF